MELYHKTKHNVKFIMDDTLSINLQIIFNFLHLLSVCTVSCQVEPSQSPPKMSALSCRPCLRPTE